MGADLTADVTFLQGLILQDPRFTAAFMDDDLSSSATQAGPVVGHAVAQQDTNMVLETVGTQSADKALRVQVNYAGHPGTDEAQIVYSYDTEADTEKRGRDVPLTISDMEFIDYSSTAGEWAYPDAVACDSGKIVAVCQKLDTSHRIVAQIRDPSAGTWSEVEIHDHGSTYSDGGWPCLLLLPSGRLVTFFWAPASSGGNIGVRMHYSDDDGSTWTVGQRLCDGVRFTSASNNYKRLRATHLNGQILLTLSYQQPAGSPKHLLFQYASPSLGAAFSLISTLDTGNSRCRPLLLTLPDRIVVAYISHDGTNEVPYCRILGSAYDPLSSATAIKIVNGSTTHWGVVGTTTPDVFDDGEAELAGFVADDGSLYLWGLDYAGNRELVSLRSTDGGETWREDQGSSSSSNHDGTCLWQHGAATTYPTDFCAVWWRGCGVLIHTAAVVGEAGTDVGASLMATFFGGHTNVTMPPLLDIYGQEPWERAGFENTWLSFCRPDDLDWTYSSSGSPTVIANSKGIGITHTGVSDAGGWTQDITNDLSGGGIFLLEIDHEVNDQLETDVLVTISDGSSTSYTMVARVDGAAIAIYDIPGGTVTGSPVVSLVMDDEVMDGIQLLVAVREVGSTGKGAVWWRPRGPTDRKWTPAVSNRTLTSGTLTQARISFSTNAGQATGSAIYKLACLADGSYTGEHLAQGQDLSARLGTTVMPTPVYLDDGVSIYASAGPGYIPDAWHIDTRYTYGYRNTDPRTVPTVDLGWRTLNDDSDADLVWKIGASTADEHAQMGSYLALYLGECNWRTAELWGRTGASWAKILDIDMALATVPGGLGFTRKGYNILPNLAAGSNLSDFLQEHILAGSTWDYDDDTTPPRKISTNTSGAWTLAATATVKPPRLLLSTYETTDPTSGTTGRIWSKEAVVMLPRTLASSYDAVRLRIKAHTTADGYFNTGIALLGWFMPFGEVYSQGRSISIEPNYEMSTGRSGARTVRALGRSRRAVEFDWTDGVWTEGLATPIAQPDYWRYLSSGEPVAHPASVAWDVMGAYERAKGAVEPCAYVARVPVQPGPTLTTNTITNRGLFLYGRLVSEAVRIDVAEGDEWSTTRPEYVRVNTTRIEEEV